MQLPSKILLDTNVWLDAFDGARPRSSKTNELIDACEQKGIDLMFAAGSAKDVYYIIGASLKRQARTEEKELSENQARAIATYAAACVSNMSEVATAVGVDASDIWLAQKYQRVHADFEDCLILAAAERAQTDYLVTNDDALLRHAPMAALSVEDFLAHLEAASTSPASQ